MCCPELFLLMRHASDHFHWNALNWPLLLLSRFSQLQFSSLARAWRSTIELFPCIKTNHKWRESTSFLLVYLRSIAGAKHHWPRWRVGLGPRRFYICSWGRLFGHAPLSHLQLHFLIRCIPRCLLRFRCWRPRIHSRSYVPNAKSCDSNTINSPRSPQNWIVPAPSSLSAAPSCEWWQDYPKATYVAPPSNWVMHW